MLDENVASWSQIVFALKSIMNMRFDDPNKDENDLERDVLLCPKCHFDTRNAEILTNADAVGAYNIARRAMIAIEKIRQADRYLQSKDIKVLLKEWDKYTYEQYKNSQRDL